MWDSLSFYENILAWVIIWIQAIIAVKYWEGSIAKILSVKDSLGVNLLALSFNLISSFNLFFFVLSLRWLKCFLCAQSHFLCWVRAQILVNRFCDLACLMWSLWQLFWIRLGRSRLNNFENPRLPLRIVRSILWDLLSLHS